MNNIDVAGMKFENKEHVIFFMMTTSISLSHYDYKFISNMQSLTHDKKQITSGQAELFDKLLHKYRKQFATNGYESNNLIDLPWKCIVVPSLPKYTNANVDYDDVTEQLIIRVPFKKEFINQFRKEMTDQFPVNDNFHGQEVWKWNTESKRYEANPTTHALKLAYQILPKFFTTVYHNEVKDIITQLESNPINYPDPTLVNIDGQYTVVSSNDVLDELLAKETLDNTPQCLYRMSQLGIKVDESITQNDEKLLFASSYIVECDIDKINDWCDWLCELNVDEILLGRGSPSSGAFDRVNGTARSNVGMDVFKEARLVFEKNNINMHMTKDLLSDTEVAKVETKGLPVLVQFNSIVEPEQCHGANRNGKIIIITNRRTVNIS